jgi:hypothetical protein
MGRFAVVRPAPVRVSARIGAGLSDLSAVTGQEGRVTDKQPGRGGAPHSGRGVVAEHPGQGHILDRITEQM